MAKVGPDGDDATTLFLGLPRYVANFGAVMTAKQESVTAMREPDGEWRLHFALQTRKSLVRASCPFNADGPRVVDGDNLLRWGVTRLGPGVWVLSESINVEGVYHGYIVMRDVPEPAPWLPAERL